MAVPQVAIVGRPNVGKSSLLNWLADKRISIVDDKAGVTRDRVTHLMEYSGRFFELVDTGGIGIVDDDNLSREVEEQIDVALELADIVLFVVDTRTGLLPLDSEVARRLRYIDKPMICVANKTDDEKMDPQADEFYKLGRGKLVKVSTHHTAAATSCLDMIHERLPDMQNEETRASETYFRVLLKIVMAVRFDGLLRFDSGNLAAGGVPQPRHERDRCLLGPIILNLSAYIYFG